MAQRTHTIPGKFKPYQVNDQVWLDTRNLRIPGKSPKFLPRREGTFRILKKNSNVNYTLKLPPHWHIHPTFHASKLHPYHETPEYGSPQTRPPPDTIDGDEFYEGEEILDERRRGRGTQYLVKFKGIPRGESVWLAAKKVREQDPELLNVFLARRTEKAA